MAIELKEMSQYPVLESPHTVSNPVVPPPNDPSASAPRTLPQYLTPIVPIASNPPPMSFVEQQRLRAQEARPEERKDYPSLPPQPQRVSMPHRTLCPTREMPTYLYRLLGLQRNHSVSSQCSHSLLLAMQGKHCNQTTSQHFLPVLQDYLVLYGGKYHVRCRCGTLYAISQVPA